MFNASKLLPGMNRKRALAILALFLIAWGTRACYVTNTVIDKPLRADAAQYFASAYNLVRYNIYSSEFTGDRIPQPDSLRAPGYPLFLVPFIKSSNNLIVIYRRVVHIQALLDSLTVMLVFFMAYALLPFRAAFLSALLAAFNPHLIVMCAYLLSETLYTFLLAAGMLFMVLAAKKMRYPMFLAAGLLLGLATLTRPALFLFPFIALPLTAILTGNRTRSFLKSGALLLAAFLIVQAPWAIRNLGVHPPPGRDVNVLRASFIHGSYPGFVYKDPRYYGYPYRDDPRYKEMEGSWDRTFEILGRRIAAEPLKYAAWYFGGKVIALWQWDMRAGGAGDLYTYPHQTDGFRQINFLKILRSAYRLLYPLVLIAGFSGFVYYLVRKRWRDPAEAPFLPVPILLFYFAGIHTVLAPFPRYSIPLRPYIIVLAVYGSLAAVQRFFKETSG